jgi:hypothetical protein
MSTLKIAIPSPPSAIWTEGPRRARFAAALFIGLYQAVQRLRASLSPASRAPGADVREVRRLADSMRRSDPRVAAELDAAADRHELLHGG